MRRFQILMFSLALGAFGSVDAQAQMSFTEEELKAFQEKVKNNLEQKSDGGGRSRRRDTGGAEAGGAAAGGGGQLSYQERLNAVRSGQVTQQKKKKATTWEEFLGGASTGAVTKVDTAIQKIIKKQITVIAGDRVTDAVTGELLDDAREIRVDEDKKDEYYDDGTHGDLVAGDGQYTRVEEITGVIGPKNQRIKEQLIQALYEVSRLDARQFYGHTIMSTDHSTRPERNRRWALVDAPEDRAGFRISEISTDKSVEMPDFWKEEASRDVKIAGPNGWARSFLDEYRLEKGGLTSDFYPPYVPHPPTIPKIPPPSAEGWSPFVAAYDPGSSSGGGAFGGKGVGKDKGGGANFDPSRPFGAVEAASKFANRGAGAGSTSGGYFQGK